MIHAQIQRIPFVAPTTREQQLAVTAWAARLAPDREALRETLQALGIVPLDKPAETAQPVARMGRFATCPRCGRTRRVRPTSSQVCRDCQEVEA